MSDKRGNGCWKASPMTRKNKYQVAHRIVFPVFLIRYGGQGGIRTHDSVAAVRHFQCRALDQLCDLPFSVRQTLFERSIAGVLMIIGCLIRRSGSHAFYLDTIASGICQLVRCDDSATMAHPSHRKRGDHHTPLCPPCLCGEPIYGNHRQIYQPLVFCHV